jgi:FkbM family methyltransferase
MRSQSHGRSGRAAPAPAGGKRRAPASIWLVMLLCTLLSGASSGQEPARDAPADTSGWDAFLSEAKERFALRRPEIVIRHFFRDRRNGFFLDVGAADFKKWNTTYYLEERLGWSGIAVDALDHWRAGYEVNRPKTKFFTYIVTDHTGAKEPFFRIKGDTGSTALRERAEMIVKKAPSQEIQEVMVPTTTLDALLEGQGVKRIDLLSMDIEQGEPAALAGFDIKRFAPELVCIEHLPEVQAKILEYFARHGYRRIERYLEYDTANWYFTPG